jgi:type II secretory pathway pseudopilin PulG
MIRSLRTNDRRRTSAYSLLELTIVLAIIASLMAIAWPRVTPMLTRGNLRDGGRQLKAELAMARQSAIQSGRVWEFRVLPGTGNFVVAPQLLAADPSGQANQHDAIATPELLQLPDRLIFSLTPSSDRIANVAGVGGADQAAVPFSESAVSNSGLPDNNFAKQGSSFEQFSLVARFAPDGRSANKTLYVVQSETGHQLPVHVRGLTGSVVLGDVQRSGIEGQPSQNPTAASEGMETTERRRSSP